MWIKALIFKIVTKMMKKTRKSLLLTFYCKYILKLKHKKYVMTKILIISTPPGFAPEHIRKQWIDIEIPLLGIENSQKPVGNRSGTENLGGYQVLPKDAIAALEKAGKHEAVEFWTPYSGAQNFTFKKEVCKLIE